MGRGGRKGRGGIVGGGGTHHSYRCPLHNIPLEL